MLLSLAGGTLGLFLAHWVSRVVAAMLVRSFQLPRIGETSTDAWVFGFALLISLATGAMFGLTPALSSSAPDLNKNLREAGRSATGSIRGSRLRGALVVAEMALALVLLTGAGLLLKSLLVMRNTAPGFDTRNLLAVDFSIPRGKLRTFAERSRFFTNILARAESVPDVRSAALVADLPLGGGQDGLGFHIPGRPDPQPGKLFQSNFNIASPGYFRTMGISLVAGRDFDDQDSNGAPAIIVSEVAAKRFWPGEDPIGKRIVMNSDPKTTITLSIVGEVKDVRQFGLGIAPAPMIYLDYAQPGPDWGWLVMVVRTAGDPSALKGTLKSVAAHADPEVPVLQVRSMDEILAASLAQPGVYTILLGGFASLALLLAAVGLYGVVSSTVTQRTHEMGIRAALGAGRDDIARLVLRQGVVLAAAGIALGLFGAAAFSRLLTHLIPTVQPGDLLTFTSVAALLMAVALVASLLPARRAMRVDPTIALRYE
jgi:putative ABC transport system permease protein